MSNAIEIEAKALVSKSDYEKLTTAFHTYKHFIQTNFYIDNDEGYLRKEGLALRIREKYGNYEMTLKTPLSHGLLEKNEALSEQAFDDFMRKGKFPDNDLKRFLTMLDVDVETLKVKTSLTTNRIDVPYFEGKLSIDENNYSGKKDYEVELEYNNEAEAESLLRELFEKYSIPFSLNKKTKVARAFEALNGDK